MKKLDQLRTRIVALKADSKRIDALLPARDDAAVVLRQQLVAMAAEGEARLRVYLGKVASGTEQAASLFQARIGPFHGMGHAPLGPLLCALLTPAALMNVLDPYLEGLPEGISDDDRKAQIAAIDAELWALELEEERLIVGAEERGETVQRRPDANPAAVLWMPD